MMAPPETVLDIRRLIIIGCGRAHPGPACGFLIFGFRSPISLLFCFIAVVLTICLLLCYFTDEVEDFLGCSGVTEVSCILCHQGRPTDIGL